MTRYHCVAITAFAAAVVACGADRTTDEEPMTPASEIRQSPPEVIQLGDAEECQSNLDCPAGHVCGFDPDRSRVVRYCMLE